MSLVCKVKMFIDLEERGGGRVGGGDNGEQGGKGRRRGQRRRRQRLVCEWLHLPFELG